MAKVAIITGGATRVGAYISENLAKNGWRVAIHYNRSSEQAKKLCAEINEYSQSIIFQQDFSSNLDMTSLFESVKSNLGTPNLLINNASVFFKDNILSVSKESLESHGNVNLHAPILLTRKMMEFGSKHECNVINILDSSIDLVRSKSFLSYSLSKLSMINFMGLDVEQVENKCFRINSISPGFILKPDEETDVDFAKRISTSKTKFTTTLEQLYRAIEFILSNKNLNGENIKNFDPIKA